MKTESYNPSSLEVEMANIIEILKDKINDEFKNRQITSIEHKLKWTILHLTSIFRMKMATNTFWY